MSHRDKAWLACTDALHAARSQVSQDTGWWRAGALVGMGLQLFVMILRFDRPLLWQVPEWLAFIVFSGFYRSRWLSALRAVQARERARNDAFVASARPALARLRILDVKESRFQYSGIHVEIDERTWSVSTIIESVHLLNESGPEADPQVELAGQMMSLHLNLDPGWSKGTVVEEPALLVGGHSLHLLR